MSGTGTMRCSIHKTAKAGRMVTVTPLTALHQITQLFTDSLLHISHIQKKCKNEKKKVEPQSKIGEMEAGGQGTLVSEMSGDIFGWHDFRGRSQWHLVGVGQRCSTPHSAQDGSQH